MARALTLAPNGSAVRDLLAAGASEAAIAGDSVATFAAFSARTVERRWPLRIPSPTERLALALAAAEEAGLQIPPRSASGLAVALSDLHGSGVTPAQLRGIGPETPLLAAVLRRHTALLEARSLCDARALPRLAADAIRKGAALGFERVEIAPRSSLTQAELDLCAALAERAEVCVRLPFDAAREELFGPLNAAHQELFRGAGRVSVEALDPGATATGGFGEALRTLFTREENVSESLQAFSTGSPETETREVAVRVRDLLRAGVAPDRIAVSGSGPTLEPFAHALRAAGIPVAAASMQSLKRTPPGQLALALLRLCELGIPRDGLCQLLASGQLGLGWRSSAGGASRRAARWIRALREEGCGDQRSGTLLPPLRLWVARKPHHAPELVVLEGAVKRIEGLPETGTSAHHATALWEVMRSLSPRPEKRSQRKPAAGIQLSLLDARLTAGQSLPAPIILWSAAEAQDALDGFKEVVSELVSLEKGHSPLPVMSRAGFASLLEACLEHAQARTALPSAGGVALGEVQSLIGRDLDHVIFVGQNDERIELFGGGDLWLDDGLRAGVSRRLDRPAALPPTGPKAQQRYRDLTFYLACCSARVSITASRSRSDELGNATEPSASFMQIARRAARGAHRLDFSARPLGADCLTRAEAVSLDPDATQARAEGGALAVELAQLRQQTRDREAAIRAGRTDRYSGGLYAADLLAELREHLSFSPEKAASPSRLDKLTGCGFRGFVEQGLNLKADRIRGDWLDAMGEGTLFHRCLEVAFRALKTAGLLPLQGGVRRPTEQAVFLAGVREVLDTHEQESAPGHPLVWGALRRKTERQLLRVYAAELSEADGFTPSAFELNYGSPETPAVALELEDGTTVFIGGKIDRLDARDGDLRVIDYKRGSIEAKERRLRRLLGRADLQLPVYAWLASAGRLGRAADALYFSVERAERSKALSEICMEHGIDLQAFLGPARADAEGPQSLVTTLREVIGRARSGQLPVVPGDCANCPLSACCRVGPLYEELDD
jgi:hypothetical protein